MLSALLSTEMQLQMMVAAGIDKTILFYTAPHPEKAFSLNELEAEMDNLYKVLSGSNSKEANIIRQQKNISELVSITKKHPDRFGGFGSVPLGMTLNETQDWITDYIISNSLQGLGNSQEMSNRFFN